MKLNMGILKKLIVLYGVGCLYLMLSLGYRSYYTNLVNLSPIFINNRDYTMGLFFKKWDDINEKYFFMWSNDADTQDGIRW